MPNTKRGFGGIGIIIIILLALGLGAYFWSQKKVEAPAPTNVVLSPKTGDVWVIGEPHTIKLTVDPHTIPMVSGVGLQDKNGKFAGTIDCLKYGGEDQHKEFEWDTKTVIRFCGAGPSEERYSEIVPGDYRIVLVDNSSSELGSNYFTISASPVIPQ